MQLDFCRSLLFKKSDDPTIEKVHTLLQFWRHQPLLTLITPRRKALRSTSPIDNLKDLAVAHAIAHAVVRAVARAVTRAIAHAVARVVATFFSSISAISRSIVASKIACKRVQYSVDCERCICIP